MSGAVKDVIRKVLEKNGPLTKEEIVNKVLKERYVKENTIWPIYRIRNYLADRNGRYQRERQNSQKEFCLTEAWYTRAPCEAVAAPFPFARVVAALSRINYVCNTHDLFRKKHYVLNQEIAAELAAEMFAMPHDHGRGTWLLLIGSLLSTVLIGMFVFVRQLPLPLGSLLEQVYGYVYLWYPLWLPILLLKIFLEIWLKYIRLGYMRKAGEVLLEIRIPKIIEKTPKAMELFFMAMYETGSVDLVETYWDGKVRPWFSYEIVSFGGEIHFYVWTWKRYRNS